jgi:hypothetical protein
MAKTQTNETTRKIIAYLFKQGVFAWRQETGGIYDKSRNIYRTAAKTGVSDILACLPSNGTLLAIEVKTGTDRLRDEQIGFLENVRRMGGLAIVAKDFEDFLNQWSTL